jgi:polar amino acid transport system ATP-binding protein
VTLHKAHDLLDAVGELPHAPDGLVVEATGVHKYFGRLHVLRGVDLTVRKREVVVIIGPSGSGKTTFLRCINHLERIQDGRIWVNGQLIGYRDMGAKVVEDKEKNIAAQRSQIGFVFQRFNLFPHLTALENIMEAPVQVRGTPEDEAREMGLKLLERVGLEAKVDTYPGQLSGGQQQRVAIARAIVGRPAVLFADEPTGNLDSATGAEILGVLRDAVDSHGQTTVMVTHDAHAAAVADRVVFLADGRIEDDLYGATEDQILDAVKEVAR